MTYIRFPQHHNYPPQCACTRPSAHFYPHRGCTCPGCPGDCWCGGYDPDYLTNLKCGCATQRLHFGYCCIKYLIKPEPAPPGKIRQFLRKMKQKPVDTPRPPTLT